ncbi:hypothetical protein [Rhodoferax aquaticus]|uniref:Uncharacterized protein n=1 Tax=Rhodoferax aquaticus TaxID=2527691 RepID=A0A515ET16_9BURK|nr:hypothetical protein [Rhodoferax aquaticus]QDL55810.1 hypothetical protein EXZ61_17445 [Rhodoferax aquaticus]
MSGFSVPALLQHLREAPSSLGATDTLVLPLPQVASAWLYVAWGLVLAWGLGALVQSFAARVGLHAHGLLARRVAAVLAFGWAWVPGPWGPVHWLGLAFLAPSVGTALLSAACVWGCARPLSVARRGLWFLPVCGVLLGWVLLLDTFALLPGEWYAFGFSAAAVWVVAAVACVPWLFWGTAQTRWIWALLPIVVLVFVALRLPTGNVWDAVLDPWLWLVLQGMLVRKVLALRRSRKRL